MKNLILAALLTVSPVTGLQDSLATAAATTLTMEAAQEDLTVTAQSVSEAVAQRTQALEARANEPVLSEPFEVEVTFYFASKRWGTKTASGALAQVGTMAADPAIAYGTQYYIPQLGYIKSDAIFTVEDRGSAIRGNVIDIYLPNPDRSDPITQESMRIGRFTTTAYRVLTGAEAAQKRALQNATQVSSQVTNEAIVASVTELHKTQDSADQQPTAEATIPLEPHPAPSQDFNSKVNAQRKSK
jgi:3D (Asp-Asp-Asp) domain-containing protein